MTLQQLKYLVAVQDQMSIKDAAKAHKVSQPTITIAIQQLEKELNAKLLDRTNYPVTLSQIGIKAAEQARIAVKEADLVTEVVRQAKKGFFGPVRTSIVTTDKELKKRVLKAQNDIGKAMFLLDEMGKSLGSAGDTLEAISQS